MTQIRWFWEDEMYCCGILVQGHANYTKEWEKGGDIVCSAVSALVQTLAAGMEQYCPGYAVHRQAEGMFSLAFYGAEERTRTLFYSIILGLEQIAAQYPEHVDVQRVMAGEEAEAAEEEEKGKVER